MENSHSLKDKRHVVKGLKDRLRHKFNVSVAEIDYQDLWQRALVAAVTVASDHAHGETQSARQHHANEEIPPEAIRAEQMEVSPSIAGERRHEPERQHVADRERIALRHQRHDDRA